MKKFIALAVAVLVVLVAGLVVTIVLSINPIIEKAVNTYGPKMADTDVRLGKASVSFLSGSGSLSDLFVGNPEGFTSPSSMELGDINIRVDKNSLTKQTVVIEKIVITDPTITYETKGKINNIQTLLNNVKKNVGGSSDSSSGSSSPKNSDGAADKAEADSGKKLVIKELIITGGQINLVMPMLGGKNVTLPMGDIRMTDIGEDNKADPAAVFASVLAAVNRDVTSSVSSGLKDVTGKLGEGAKSVGGAVGEKTKDVGDKIKSLFD